jgi:hypothetical protein
MKKTIKKYPPCWLLDWQKMLHHLTVSGGVFNHRQETKSIILNKSKTMENIIENGEIITNNYDSIPDYNNKTIYFDESQTEEFIIDNSSFQVSKPETGAKKKDFFIEEEIENKRTKKYMFTNSCFNSVKNTRVQKSFYLHCGIHSDYEENRIPVNTKVFKYFIEKYCSYLENWGIMITTDYIFYCLENKLTEDKIGLTLTVHIINVFHKFLDKYIKGEKSFKISKITVEKSLISKKEIVKTEYIKKEETKEITKKIVNQNKKEKIVTDNIKVNDKEKFGFKFLSEEQYKFYNYVLKCAQTMVYVQRTDFLRYKNQIERFKKYSSKEFLIKGKEIIDCWLINYKTIHLASFANYYTL